MASLSSKTALITGCNRGIGKAILEKLASLGCNVICATRNQTPEFEEFTLELSTKFDVSIQHIYFDLNDEESIKTSLNQLIKTKPTIDILINNAGIAYGGIMLMTPLKKIKEVFQVNYFSQILITQYIAKIMTKQKSGVIINISSVMAMENFAGGSAYAASKAAVATFTRTTANELAPFNIRVNAIAPGLIETEMGDAMDQKTQELFNSRSDFKRRGTPQEVADLIAFLVSDEAKYITGQIIRIDGGM